ncbi:MAG: trypsin-like serine protease, partial [Acidimicrobiia bacterium]|nr:trypsin-like serine protease [Acidimicrobiia bacterium]
MRKTILYPLVAVLAVAALLSPTVVGAQDGADDQRKPFSDLEFADSDIVGGTPASIDDWPSYVFMQASVGGGTFSCAGTLVDPMYVLTAAHCVAGIPSGPLASGQILFGYGELRVSEYGPEDIYEGERLWVFEDYNVNVGDDGDLAIVKLTE